LSAGGSVNPANRLASFTLVSSLRLTKRSYRGKIPYAGTAIVRHERIL